MSTIYTKTFWKGTAERAISTVAQTAISLLTVGSITGLLGVAWLPLLSAVLLAGLLSVLKSIVAGTTGDGPGFGTAEVVADKVVAQETKAGVVVAGQAYIEDRDGEDIQYGTPVVVDSVEVSPEVTGETVTADQGEPGQLDEAVDTKGYDLD